VAEKGPLPTVGGLLATLRKTLKNDGGCGCGWLYQKPKITNKYSEKRKKILKTKRILKPKYKPSGGSIFTFTVAGRGGQFGPPAAAGRPKRRKNFHRLYLRGVEKFWRYFPLTRSSQVCHQKIFLSLLHSIGIQLIQV